MNDRSETNFAGRRLLVRLLLLAITAGLLWRAVDLQHTEKDFLIGQGDAGQFHDKEVPYTLFAAGIRGPDPVVPSLIRPRTEDTRRIQGRCCIPFHPT